MLQPLEADLDIVGRDFMKTSHEVPRHRRPLGQTVDDGTGQGVRVSSAWQCLPQHVEMESDDPPCNGRRRIHQGGAVGHAAVGRIHEPGAAILLEKLGPEQVESAFATDHHVLEPADGSTGFVMGLDQRRRMITLAGTHIAEAAGVGTGIAQVEDDAVAEQLLLELQALRVEHGSGVAPKDRLAIHGFSVFGGGIVQPWLSGSGV